MGFRPPASPLLAFSFLPLFVSAIHAQAVWGYADLHTHPASHLGFGADASGNNGIVWGKPGGEYETSINNIGSDLPPCLNTHVVLFPNPAFGLFSILSVVPSTPIPVSSFHGSPNDYIQLETQRIALSMLDQEGPPDRQHHEHGAPGFEDWPSAAIVEHQQMHITAIKRAYLGGLRLMFAAAVDSQILNAFWTKTGFNVLSQVPNPEPGFDYRSAIKQLQFIQNEVAANSTWMQIVKTPTEARQAIAANKLAVVLSLEMDALTPDEVQSLIAVYNVRHVTPIHLANSSYGGSAVYNDNWNTNNWFLNNHQFVQVDFDTNITFRLGKPNSLISAMGALIPTAISDDDYNKLGYQAQAGGHKNHLGITDPNALQELMEAGVIIDLAHMSEKSIDMALSQAEIYRYPLMDSHTGIRNPLKPASLNERSLLNSQATRIGNLGGVLGLGAAWDKDSTDPVGDFSAAYQNALLLLGGRGVALGTDANGLQTLIDSTKDPLTDYVHNIAGKFSPPTGVQTPDLNHYTIGSSRPFDIHVDGLANYGMLPDFLEAVWEYEQKNPKASSTVGKLFQSAEDVIEMWEKVVAASSTAVPPHAVCQQPNYPQCITTADNNFTSCKKDWDGPTTHATTCAFTLQNALNSCFNQFCQTPKPTQLAVTARVIPPPPVDNGRFKLLIDGNVELSNASDQANTGLVTVKLGPNTAGEAAETGTNIGDYVVQFGGDCSPTDTTLGPLTRPVTMSVGQQKTCAITNLGFPAVTLTLTNKSTKGGNFNILVDGTPVATSTNATGLTTRVKSLSSSTHSISFSPADTTTVLSNYAFTFGRDCVSRAADSPNGSITLAAGDQKVCVMFILDPGQGGCPPGQRSCGNASGLPGDPPVCVDSGNSCNALCGVNPRGVHGVFCDVNANGKPVCVYPPANCP